MTRFRRHYPGVKAQKANATDLIVKVDNTTGLVLEAVRSGGMATVEMRECFGAWHRSKHDRKIGTLIPASQFPPSRNDGRDKGRTCLSCRDKARVSAEKNRLKNYRRAEATNIMLQAPPVVVLDEKHQKISDKTVERMVTEKAEADANKLPQWRVTILKVVTITQEETRVVDAKDFLDAGAVASSEGEVVKVERIR